MAFHEGAIFPTDINEGSESSPGFRTVIVETDDGSEQRSGRWSTPKHTFDVAYGVKSQGQFSALKKFWMARNGALYGFRFKDWLDFTTASDGTGTPLPTDEVLGIGDGSTTSFQLRKRYVNDTSTVVRPITKPVTGTVVVALDGVTQTTGFAVNTTTGVVTFTTPPASGVSVTAGCEFAVPVRFSAESDKALRGSYDDFSNRSVRNVSLVEINDGLRVLEDFPYRGSCSWVLPADDFWNPALGAMQKIEANASGLNLKLPDPADLAPGGPWGWIKIVGANDVQIQTHTGTDIVLVSPGSGVELLVSENGTGDHEWVCV